MGRFSLQRKQRPAPTGGSGQPVAPRPPETESPTQWGRSYEAVRNFGRLPATAPIASETPAAPARPPIVGSGTRRWLQQSRARQRMQEGQ
jgi:hypothetical protein